VSGRPVVIKTQLTWKIVSAVMVATAHAAGLLSNYRI